MSLSKSRRERRQPKGATLFLVIVAILTMTTLSNDGQAAESSSTYTKTRYPIVLAHGMAGFDKLFGVYEYWYGIVSALTSGGAEVYVAEVSPMASTEARGEQLLAQIEMIVAMTGHAKVNLVGHSHGGLDGRYVAAFRPDLIASVTTVGTPHRGAELATYLRDHISEEGVVEGVSSLLANVMSTVLGLLAGHSRPNDSLDALEALSDRGAAAFNARYPAGLPKTTCGEGAYVENGIRFYSWSGTGVFTNLFDPGDSPLGIASLFYGDDNDGLVGRCSAHFGRVLRDNYAQNHLDEVNQLFGLTNIFSTNPKSVFRTHANRLKRAGL